MRLRCRIRTLVGRPRIGLTLFGFPSGVARLLVGSGFSVVGRLSRPIKFDIGPVSAVEDFGDLDKFIQSRRRGPTSRDELRMHSGCKRMIVCVPEVSIGPTWKPILDRAKLRREVSDMIFVGHGQSFEIRFGSAFGVFQTPSPAEDLLELVPGCEPCRTMF
jgi:hypothetical protein